MNLLLLHGHVTLHAHTPLHHQWVLLCLHLLARLLLHATLGARSRHLLILVERVLARSPKVLRECHNVL
jgi:hypothetical protein